MTIGFPNFCALIITRPIGGYGGKGTLISYLNHAGKNGKYFASRNGYKTALVKEDIPLRHRRFFEELFPYYIDDKKRCFLHAGFNPKLPFFGQRREEYFWNRELWDQALSCQNNPALFPDGLYAEESFKEIFVGHNPTTKLGTDKPMQALNIHNLDTGAGGDGRLTVMDVDTKQYWQSDPVFMLYSVTGAHR